MQHARLLPYYCMAGFKAGLKEGLILSCNAYNIQHTITYNNIQHTTCNIPHTTYNIILGRSICRALWNLPVDDIRVVVCALHRHLVELQKQAAEASSSSHQTNVRERGTQSWISPLVGYIARHVSSQEIQSRQP